ncbi:hypothetical protein ACFL1D_04410 [Candidatus Omnitrophota bacterium]
MKNPGLRIRGRKSGVLISLIVSWILLLTGSIVFADEPGQKANLDSQAIKIEDRGVVGAGDLTITALASDAIIAGSNLFIKIPQEFPVFWDTAVKTLSLSADSSRGLVNEAVTYPDQKTLRITVTNSWPLNSKITVVNLKINLPELPAYEDILGGELTNLAYFTLSGFSADNSSVSSQPILLKIPPFYAGDDGWSESGSPGPGVPVSYDFTNFQSTYPPGYYLADRGFSAVVYAIDALDNWVDSNDTVVMSSYLSALPATSGNAVFYTDANYNVTTTTYTLNQGYSYIYVVDDTPETIELKAARQGEPTFFGTSDAVTVEPYAYTISASSPHTLDIGWPETVALKDIHDNLITDTPPTQVTISSNGNAYFYPDSNYNPGDRSASRNYTLTSGTCTIYLDDEVAENVRITANDIYDSLNNGGGGTSNLIVVTVSTWQVRMDFAYDEAEGAVDDKLTVRVWLEREGNLVNDANLGLAALSIYDASSFVQTLSPDPGDDPDSDGSYWFTWNDTGLTSGRSYFVRLSLAYGNETHWGGEDFYLTMNKTLGSLISDSTAAIQGLQSTAEGISDEVINQISPQLGLVKTDTEAAVTATEVTIPGQITAAKEELEPHIYARILNTETQVVSGGALAIRFRAPAGSSPVLDLYNAEQTQLASALAMTAVGTTGVYEYELTFDSAWGSGFFTVICSEPTYNTLDGVTINVTTADLESVARDVSAVLGSTAGLQGAGDVGSLVDTAFSDITDKLASINERIVDATTAAVKGVLRTISSTQAEGIYQAMSVVSETMQNIGTSTTGELESLYEVSIESSEDLDYVRNKFIELENLLTINKEMMDTVTYEPIVQTWYEFR